MCPGWELGSGAPGQVNSAGEQCSERKGSMRRVPDPQTSLAFLGLWLWEGETRSCQLLALGPARLLLACLCQPDKAFCSAPFLSIGPSFLTLQGSQRCYCGDCGELPGFKQNYLHDFYDLLLAECV